VVLEVIMFMKSCCCNFWIFFMQFWSIY